MRRWWLLLVVPALLVLGLWAPSAFAQGPDEGTTPPPPARPAGEGLFYERVASALGLEAEQVRQAFEQARREAWEARLDRVLSRLVEVGRLTREQADALRDWLAQRPDVPFGPFRPQGRPSLERVAELLGVDPEALRDAVAQARRAVEEERLARRLDRLVEAGRLTREEADALLEWFRSRPEGVPGLGRLLRPHPRPHPHGWGRGWARPWMPVPHP